MAAMLIAVLLLWEEALDYVGSIVAAIIIGSGMSDEVCFALILISCSVAVMLGPVLVSCLILYLAHCRRKSSDKD